MLSCHYSSQCYYSQHVRFRRFLKREVPLMISFPSSRGDGYNYNHYVREESVLRSSFIVLLSQKWHATIVFAYCDICTILRLTTPRDSFALPNSHNHEPHQRYSAQLTTYNTPDISPTSSISNGRVCSSTLHHWPRIPLSSGHTKPLWPGITIFGCPGRD